MNESILTKCLIIIIIAALLIEIISYTEPFRPLTPFIWDTTLSQFGENLDSDFTEIDSDMAENLKTSTSIMLLLLSDLIINIVIGVIIYFDRKKLKLSGKILTILIVVTLISREIGICLTVISSLGLNKERIQNFIQQK